MKAEWRPVLPFVKDENGIIVGSEPPLGENVLIWHPVFEVEIAKRKADDSFWDSHGNELSLGKPIEWWMPLPEAPDSEEAKAAEAFAERAWSGNS